MSTTRIRRIINKGRKALNHADLPEKELNRFSEVYLTVYTHAMKKGQTHRAALSYCWNVYADQAPDLAKKIVKNMMRNKMSLNKKALRQMIIKEMTEGDVIDITDFRRRPVTQEFEPDEIESQQDYDGFISEMHNQLTGFMSDSASQLTPKQTEFLDNILDMLEEELGIDEEEGIDFDEDEDFEDDL